MQANLFNMSPLVKQLSLCISSLLSCNIKNSYEKARGSHFVMLIFSKAFFLNFLFS